MSTDNSDSGLDPNSIDESIKALDAYIDMNMRSSKRIFSYLSSFTILCLSFVFFMLVMLPILDIPLDVGMLISENRMGIIYIAFTVFIVVFGVMTALYRFHLNEISKSEHYKMGFMRIRVAANNFALHGFQSEVRTSLTNDAFSSPAASGKDRKVKSPLPGHPSSDLSAIVLSKILDKVEIKAKDR